MSSARASRLKSWLKRSRKRSDQLDSLAVSEQSKQDPTITNPVDNYYRHKAKTNLPVFYRFALQTRSLVIRDVFAKAASPDGWNLIDLLAVLQDNQSKTLTEPERRSLRTRFDSSILLALADLLANTARDDLDTNAAVRIYIFVHQVFGSDPFIDKHILQYVEALNEIGLYDQSERLAEEFNINEIAPLQTELLRLQRIRNSDYSEAAWLNALNNLYTSLGMTHVRLLPDESLHLMDRLTAGSAQPLDGPKVSVIMPTYAPGPGIRTAIRGLLEQSWQNLEIIVVNDASPAQHREFFDEIEQLDQRIRVFHQEHNLGPYVARNRGLAAATGEFVTTHDDDDWSHPDKIALQVSPMLEDNSVVATTSAHIRATDELQFRRMNIYARFLQMNYSSLMFRRSIISEVGGWDTVNRGGDSEFYTRLVEYVGSQRMVRLHEYPASFSRVWRGSLTSGEMSRGYFAYSRLLYRWAFRQWQWDAGKQNKKAVRRPGERRPYAIPTTFEAGRKRDDLGTFDVIYVTDFFRQAKFVDYVLDEIETLSEAGFRVGYLHLFSPETTKPAGFPKRLFDLQLSGKIMQVSHDDVAETRLLLVFDGSIGMFADQINSRVTAKRGLVVDHELPWISGTDKRSALFVPQALRHLGECFNCQFEVVGASSLDQYRIRSFIPPSNIASDEYIWRVHTREEARAIRVPQHRPVIGFHSYGNRYRWPDNNRIFEEIYLSGKYDTRFYGSLEPAVTKFDGASLEQIELINLEEMSQADFISSLDFWVYYPHSKLVDKIWEPVLAAMQMGKVVILPPRLAAIYKDGAVYAEAAQVSEAIMDLSRDSEAYLRQAHLGQSFVKAQYSALALQGRVSSLLS